jgi:hypothetical protein
MLFRFTKIREKMIVRMSENSSEGIAINKERVEWR